MHKSPSLFFDILSEEDESKRNEKIKRASFEIKTHLAGSPSAVKISQYNGTSSQISQQQQEQRTYQDSSLYQTTVHPASQGSGRLSTDTPALRQPGRVAFAPSGSPHCSESNESDELQQPAQKQQQEVGVAGEQLVLSPQEVLQELLGDLFIHQERLIMGDLLGQGGFADVHAAQLLDPLLPDFSESVAVKRLRPDVLKGPADLKEFLTEANLLRKLAHRNIVALRGVGASDLSDLVNMRESMFVVQEFMAGGDLKQLVISAMSRPFDPPYSKTQAIKWAMHIAEALHYLHCVCTPMIIHRDLKLDNVLLSTADPDQSVAKLADFGLHKRVRRLVSSGALVAWDQETTYHGADFERSYYGGNIYLTHRPTISTASSIIDENSVHGGSLHGGGAFSRTAATGRPNGLLIDVLRDKSAGGAAAVAAGSQKPPLYPAAGTESAAAAPAAAPPAAEGYSLGAAAGDCTGCTQSMATVAHSDSATSISDAATAASVGDAPAQIGSSAFQQQQHHLMNVVKAKSQGLLGKQDFVTQVLSAAARPELLQGPGELMHQSKDVSRTFAAVVALEGSVRAGSAYYQQQQQELDNGSSTAANKATLSNGSGRGNAKSDNKLQAVRQHLKPQQSELCPQLVADLKTGLANAKDTQAFIEATQKVGSLMYMAPEVLTGRQYNEKIDVFSFGVILYELLSGVVIAGRVALGGQHEELLDYARKVANGHREFIPPNWPAQVKSLINSCWAQDPVKRPGFKEVLKQLYAMKQAGIDGQLEQCRPKGDYNPVTDCGCTIM